MSLLVILHYILEDLLTCIKIGPGSSGIGVKSLIKQTRDGLL